MALPFAGVAMLLMLAACNAPEPADPRMIDLAVRATVHAMPTPTPVVIEVTRVVEVTVQVEVTRLVEPTATWTATATATPPPSPTPEPAANASQIIPAAAAVVLKPQAVAPACPTASIRQYASIPTVGPPASHPDHLHGDLNLALRGYLPVDGTLALTSVNGPTGSDPPQLYHLFGDKRTPQFSGLYRARDWNWGCGEHGCRGEVLERPSLAGMSTTPGEAIHAPMRSAEIYGGGYRALVLYADAERVTLGYTREDSVANGYAVHVEGLCTDANLLANYRASDVNGRGTLPALRQGDVIGAAAGSEIAVAVRDRGTFLDPRSRKDWWRGR